jgi:hypothetical protein
MTFWYMQNITKYVKYAEYQTNNRYVTLAFWMFCSQPHLWFYVQVYELVMLWTCSVCSLHTGSSCFRLVMHYTQFRADHRFVCAGHNETAWGKSCCIHCILRQQAVCRIFSKQNHSSKNLMQTRNFCAGRNETA